MSMEENQRLRLRALSKLHDWVLSGSGVSPDIERGELVDFVKREAGSKTDAGSDLLRIIRDLFNNPRSACPDVCIGSIVDECRDHARAILAPLDAFTELEEILIGILYFRPRPVAALWDTLFPYFRDHGLLDDDDDDKALAEAVRSLIAAGYLRLDNLNFLHLVLP